jgi:hypothetical protein
LVFTALFCFAPFSVFSSRMSALHYRHANSLARVGFAFRLNVSTFEFVHFHISSVGAHACTRIKYL